MFFCYNIIGIYEKVSDIMAMTKQNFKNDYIIFNKLNDLVPQDHLVRKLNNSIDFTFIEDLYSPFGRPSIPPVVLFKL